MVEVSLPLWPYQVLYMDQLYEDIKDDYLFPQHHVDRFMAEVQYHTQQNEIFDDEPKKYLEEEITLWTDPALMRRIKEDFSLDILLSRLNP